MGNFEIIKRNGERIPLNTVEPFCVVKSAVQNSSLMGDDNVQLSIISTDVLSFAKGDKIIVDGEEYTIRTKVNREELAEDHFVYDATFYGVMYELMKSLYRNTDADGKSTSHTFDLTYSIRDFVKVLIYNVNRDYPGLWQFDEENCPDTEPRTLSFSKNNCLQVLQKLCSDSEFKLEFLITQSEGVRTIHIGKFGSKVVPPGGNEYFEWGKGNGLFKLKEQKVDDKAIITRLWVEGGTNNIRSDYRNYSERLQLPYPKRLNQYSHTLEDGTIINPGSEMIGIDDDTKRYFENVELRDEIGSEEDAKTYDDIFPYRTGVVTSIVDNINSFIDSTMDFDLNEKDENGTKYLIDSVPAKITFISGKLAGQEFSLSESNGYNNETKQFTIIPFQDDRGLTIPTVDSSAYRIAVGDKYKLTDIIPPESYEQRAEEDLWYKGKAEFEKMTQPRAQYQLTFDRQYFLDNIPDGNDDCLFHVGDYVPVKDERFKLEKNIRIQKVSRNLLADHDYDLTLSDVTAISIYNQTVIDVKQQEIIIDKNKSEARQFTKRSFADVKNTMAMLEKAMLDTFTTSISPITLQTMALLVGDESLQYRFIRSLVDYTQVNDTIYWDNDTKRLKTAQTSYIQHLTYGIKSITPVHDNESYLTAAVPQYTSGVVDATVSYYLYIKVNQENKSGLFELHSQSKKFDDGSGTLYLLVGILNKEIEGNRSFVRLYGFTEVLPGRITTDRIVSADGKTYFDLANSEIGGRLTFTSNGEKQEVGSGIENAQSTADNAALKTVNLLPKRYLLDWNRITQNTCKRGSDADGNYYSINENSVYIIGGRTGYKDIFKGKIKYKPATQYVLSVRWKMRAAQLYSGLNLGFIYSDGTRSEWIALSGSHMTLTTKSLISEKGKTVTGICTTHGESLQYTSIYDIQLVEGDKALPGWLEAPQDRIIPERNILPADKSAEVIADSSTASKYAVLTPAVSIEANEDYILSVDSIVLEDTNLDDNDEWIKNPYCYIGLYKNGIFYAEANFSIAGYPQHTHWAIRHDIPSGCQLFLYPWKGYSTTVQNRVVFSGVRLAKGTVFPVLDAENRYDNTKTTIDGGIVTSGTLQVAGNKAKVRAGITGKAMSANPDAATEAYNDEAVRFWAGEEFKNRETAPARILDNGEAYFSKCYSFFPAFEINAGNMSACIKDNGINLDYTGAKIFLNKGLGNFFISLPKDPKYIGSVVEIYNPYRYQAATCNSILPVDVCTKGNMFDESPNPYPNNGSPVSGTYYALNVRMQKYNSSGWAATSPRWASFSYSVCVIDTKKYAYLKIECIALPPFCVNTAFNGGFGTNVLYSFPYALPVTISSTDSENYHAIWVVSEYILK